MTSLALRHREKMMARKNAEAGLQSIAGTAVALHDTLSGMARQRWREATEYEHKRAELGEDLRALSEIQSIEAKIARKAQLLPKYDDWCAGVLEVAKQAKDDGRRLETDDILVQTMIWAIDCGDADRALPRATVVIEHGMELPSRFERTAGCMIAEEFAEGVINVLRLGDAPAPDLAPLLYIDELTAGEDMPDQVRAKLEKAIGLLLLRRADALDDDATDGPAGGKPAAIESAIAHFRRALQLDDKSGVKKIIEVRTRELEKLRAAASS